MSGFSDFSLGSTSPILSGGKVRWKPQKGKYRATFVALPGIENQKPLFEDDNGNPTNPSFKGGRRLYRQGVGYFLDHGPEYQKIAGAPSKTSVATTLIFWPVDANGVLDKARFANGEYEVKTWVFSLDKYRQLEAINAEFPLSQHDLSITVTDPQFHKMSFAPCKESLFKTLSEKNPTHFADVVSNASSVHANIQNDIAQDLTLDQIREKLSGEVGSPAGKSGGSYNSSFDADDLLDDIL
jgi:hypothetical protein